MKRKAFALGITSVLFLAWLGYLGAKAWQYRKPPVVVSRAQLLASEFDVVAQLEADPSSPNKPSSTVDVFQVLYAGAADAPKIGDKLSVQNLAGGIGYVGPGTYVLPLGRRNGGMYYLASPPPDPGLPQYKFHDARIYPLTDAVRQQFADIRAAAKK